MPGDSFSLFFWGGFQALGPERHSCSSQEGSQNDCKLFSGVVLRYPGLVNEAYLDRSALAIVSTDKQRAHIFGAEFWERDATKQKAMKRSSFSLNGSRHSENEGIGKEFYRKGNSVKRFRPFGESPDSKN